MAPSNVPEEASVIALRWRLSVTLPLAPANRPVPPVMVHSSTISNSPGPPAAPDVEHAVVMAPPGIG